MEILYGVEVCIDESKQSRIIKEANETLHLFDTDEQLFIVKTVQEAKALEKIFTNIDGFVDTIQLILLESPVITRLFPDYGFQSKQDLVYLYADMTIPFKIVGGSETQIQMALYQIDEHLIAKELLDETIYFIDKNFISLINKYAIAYDIEVSFLHLDKRPGNH